MIDVATHSALINCVIQDAKDRIFIQNVKQQLDNLAEISDEPDKDAELTRKLLDNILAENIVEKQEIVYLVTSLEYSDNLMSLIDDTAKYTKTFKKDLLVKINSNGIVATVKPRAERILKLAERAALLSGKNSVDAAESIVHELDELGRIGSKLRNKMKSKRSNIIIIDPEDGCLGTLGGVIDDLRESVTNRIKTVPVLDGFVGGGFAPRTFNMLAAIGGGGKSLTLQNLLLFASKNNDRNQFALEEGCKPCLVYVSMEMDQKQLFLRHLDWYGVKIPPEEAKTISEKELETMVMTKTRELGFKIPVMYIVRKPEDGPTTVVDIEDECLNLINNGYQPVMISIDYLDRLEVASNRHKLLGFSGGEGAVLVRQKGRECRELASKLNLPVVSAAQLGVEAQAEITRCTPYLRQVDVLHALGINMLSGSKTLQTEVETIIFQHVFSIENKTQEGENLETRSFCTFSVMKDRDGVSKYILSDRDKRMEHEYRRATQKIQNTIGGIGEVFKNTSRLLTVIPLYGFRLDGEDYARSIRVYYPSEKSDFVSIKDLMDDFGKGITAMDSESMGYDDICPDEPIPSFDDVVAGVNPKILNDDKMSEIANI